MSGIVESESLVVLIGSQRYRNSCIIASNNGVFRYQVGWEDGTVVVTRFHVGDFCIGVIHVSQVIDPVVDIYLVVAFPERVSVVANLTNIRFGSLIDNCTESDEILFFLTARHYQ